MNVEAAGNPLMAGADAVSSGSRRFVTPGVYTASQEEPTKNAYGGHRTNLSGMAPAEGGRGNMCSYCGREFRSRSNLSRHVRDHHTSHDPSAALCPVCGKNCRNRSNVLTHMYRVHHVTARQLDAFAHPYTFPHPSPNSTRSDSLSTNTNQQQHPSAPNLSDRSQDLAVSVQTQAVQAFGSNAQSQAQQQHVSYGYSMQDSTVHHHPPHHQLHHHHQHHPPQNSLQDNT